MAISDEKQSNSTELAKVNNSRDEKIERPLSEVKHPLQNSWTLRYFRNDRAKNWEDNLREVRSHESPLKINSASL